MKKIIINQSILTNILKIAFVMIVFVIGAGEVAAVNKDEACESKSVGDSCTFDTNKTGFCTRGGGIIQGAGIYCDTDSNKWKDCNDNNPNSKNDKCKTDDNKDGICTEYKDTNDVTRIKCQSINPESDCNTLACDKKSPPQTCKITNGQAACSATDACDGLCTADQKCQIEGNDGTGRCVANDDYKCKDNPCTGATPHCIFKPGDDKGTCSSANIPAPDSTDPNDPNTPTPTIEYVEFKNPIRFNNIIELLAGITNALLTLLGVIAVLVIMSAGFKYMTSSNPGEVSQAVGGIRNAVIGIVVIMGAYLIVNYVISAVL